MLNEYPERDSCLLSPEGQGRGRRGDHVVVRGGGGSEEGSVVANKVKRES